MNKHVYRDVFNFTIQRQASFFDEKKSKILRVFFLKDTTTTTKKRYKRVQYELYLIARINKDKKNYTWHVFFVLDI